MSRGIEHLARSGAVLALLAVVSALPVSGQEALPDSAADLEPASGAGTCSDRTAPGLLRLGGADAARLRAAELAGRTGRPLAPGLRRVSDLRRAHGCPGSGPLLPVARLLGVEAAGFWRSDYADQRNDGAIWTGRGLSHGVAGGLEARWGPVTLALQPELLYRENDAFRVRDSLRAGSDRFRYPWHPLDRPLRPGANDDLRVNAGQSVLRVDAGHVRAGASTENVWWGPALRYPLVLGSAGSGFPHLFAGTGGPLRAGPIRVAGELLWGRLEESDHFDRDEANDRRLLTGLTLTLSPDFAPGLSIGLTSLYQRAVPADGLDLGETLGLLRRPLDPATADSVAADAVGSLFLRWAHPASGFEMYAEWGKEDLSESLRQLLQEPDHGQAYTLGLQKLWTGAAGATRLHAEITHRQASITARGARPFVTFGADGGTAHGWTHRGQMLGGFVGPGSDAQYLGVDVYRAWGSLGAYVERIRRDDDAYHRSLARNYGVHGHDVEVLAGLRGRLLPERLLDAGRLGLPGALAVDWDVRLASRTNRGFLDLRVPNQDLVEETNWSAELRVGWTPGGTEAPAGARLRPDAPGEEEPPQEAGAAPSDDAGRCPVAGGGLPLTSVASLRVDRFRAARLTSDVPLAAGTLRRPADLRREARCGAGAAGGTERDGEPFTVEPLPAEVVGAFRSAYPVDRNNGPLWSGRGVSGALAAGVEFRAGPFSAALRPVAHAAQNRGFDLPRAALGPDTAFTYPWNRFDWPLRFGDDGVTELQAGDSYARVDGFGLAAGVSNEGLWWGPGQRYPVTMSNTAGGFPHLFLRSSRPLDVGIGWLEGELAWGELEESAFFDADPANDERLFAGGTLAFRPAFAPGLVLGVNSLYENVIPEDGLPFGEYFEFLNLPVAGTRGGKSTEGNAFGSLFFRWILPGDGFEVYGEWGRDDFNEDLGDLLKEPDHSQVYMLGFQKVWEPEEGERRIRLSGELVHLQAAITDRSLRGIVTFYTHSRAVQGHTQRGQLLGAWVGPASDAQYLAVDAFEPWGSVGGYLERVRRSDNAYYRRFGRFGARGHDVELTLAARGTLAPEELHRHGLFGARAVDLRWEVGLSRRENRDFVGLATHEGAASELDPRTDWNLAAEVGLRWWPGR